MVADFSDVLLPGPWEHRFVSANGSRFHVAVSDDEATAQAPLIILLHSFPQMWWTWRHQFPHLTQAGYRVAAMDLRGYGASDKPPMGYDTPNLCRDVAGVIRALGASSATIIGHGIGGMIAWSMPTVVPAVTTAVAAFSSPHPARVHASTRAVMSKLAHKGMSAVIVPGAVERRLRTTDLATRILRDLTITPWPAPDLEVYRTAMRLPSVSRCSLEAVRWHYVNRLGSTYRRYLATVRGIVTVPALQVMGRMDPVFDLGWTGVDAAALCTHLRSEQVFGAGHFPHEERPDEVAEILLDWLNDSVPLP